MTMRTKLLFLTLVALCSMALNAQNPNIILKAAPDANKKLQLSFRTISGTTPVSVDWGDGVPVSVGAVPAYGAGGSDATVTELPKGTGDIKIYGDDIAMFYCSYVVAAGIKVSAVDVSNAPTLKDLNISSNDLSVIDLRSNINLELFTSDNNLFTNIDFTHNTALKNISMMSNRLTSIDLSKNTLLTKIHFGGSLTSANQLTEIDLKNNTELTSIYLLFNKLTSIDLSKNTKLTYASLNNNNLKALDIKTLPVLKSVYCVQNQITDLSVNTAVTKTLNFSRNKLVFKKMPPLVTGNTYTYAPQDTVIAIPTPTQVGSQVDLSDYNNIMNSSGVAQTTTYTWKKSDGTTLTKDVDYTLIDGKTTFLNIVDLNVYCEMSTPAYPLFTGANVVKTSLMAITPATSVEENKLNNVKLIAAQGILKFQNLEAGYVVRIFTSTGIQTTSFTASGTEKELRLSPGVYVVTINEKAQKIMMW